MRALLFPVLLLYTAATAADPPNVVLLFADDLGRYASAYADPKVPSPNDIIRTPHIDRLAREGALFDNAFVNVPSCSPCRASLVSGKYFFRNGSHSQLHTPWTPGHPDPWEGTRGFPLRLRDAGWTIGWSWKMHIDEGQMGGRARNFQSAGSRFNKFSRHVSAASDRAAEKEKLLGEVRDNFRAFLADRKPGQPFFYWLNPTNTHRTWVKGSGQDLWGLDPEALKGRMPPFLPDNAAVREDFTDYLGEGMAFDAAVGVVLAELEAMGELDRTLVIVSGDHGMPGMPRGKCNLYDFGTQVTLAMRMPRLVGAGRRIATPVSLLDVAPTVLAACGLAAPDGWNGQSLLPVLAREKPAPESTLRGWALLGREVHVGNAREGGLPYPMRGLRTGDFLYILNPKPDREPMGDPKALGGASVPNQETLEQNTRIGYADMDSSPTKAWLVQHRLEDGVAPYWDFGFGRRPEEELYDLRKDPHQMVNVASDPAYAADRTRLHDLLMNELRANRDPRLIDDAFDRPPYVVFEKPAPSKNPARNGKDRSE